MGEQVGATLLKKIQPEGWSGLIAQPVRAHA